MLIKTASKSKKTCNKSIKLSGFITCFLVTFVTIEAPSFALSCNIITTPFNFNQNYEPFFGGDVDYTSQITVSCVESEVVPYTIKLNSGTHSTSMVPFRKMQEPTSSALLNYNFFLDASRQIIWGDGTDGSQFVSRNQKCDSGTIPPCNETIYGRINSGQKNVHIGSYSDDVIVTLSY